MESALVATSTTLVRVVQAAIRTVANVSFASRAAVVDIVGVADVALLWDKGGGSFRGLVRNSGCFGVGGIGGKLAWGGGVNWVG